MHLNRTIVKYVSPFGPIISRESFTQSLGDHFWRDRNAKLFNFEGIFLVNDRIYSFSIYSAYYEFENILGGPAFHRIVNLI